jgi:predicted nucleic acid-binding protein
VKLYLFDASSIVNLIKRGSLRPLSRGITLDLAVYESLNAIWREYKLLGRLDLETARLLVEVLQRVFSIMPLESIEGFEEEVFQLAIKENLTVYDAAYLFVAIKHNLTLVSDDRELLNKASGYVKTVRTTDLLSSQP